MARSRRSAGPIGTANPYSPNSLLRQYNRILSYSPQAVLSRNLNYPLPGDRRLYDPSGHVNAPNRYGHPHHRLVVSAYNHAKLRGEVNAGRSALSKRGLKQNFLPWNVAFAEPHKVAVCIRRKMRREVMFALKLNRKGAGAGRRRRNWTSGITC